MLDTALVQHGRGMNRGAGTQRQGYEAFEHVGQLLLNDAEKRRNPPRNRGGSSCTQASVAYLARRGSFFRTARVLLWTVSAVTSALLKIWLKCWWVTDAK